jgi:hypothetical protein
VTGGIFRNKFNIKEKTKTEIRKTKAHVSSGTRNLKPNTKEKVTSTAKITTLF